MIIIIEIIKNEINYCFLFLNDIKSKLNLKFQFHSFFFFFDILLFLIKLKKDIIVMKRKFILFLIQTFSIVVEYFE